MGEASEKSFNKMRQFSGRPPFALGLSSSSYLEPKKDAGDEAAML